MTDTDDLARGRLDQVCQRCSQWEAAGPYCTRCGGDTGPGDYYLKGDVAERQRRQEIAGKMVSPPITRGRGRPRAVMTQVAV